MRVEGEVLRWHHENGKEVVPALQYIEQLEAELADLRQQVRQNEFNLCLGRGSRRRYCWCHMACLMAVRCRRHPKGLQCTLKCGPAQSFTLCPLCTDGGRAGGAGGAGVHAARTAARQPAARLPQVPGAGENLD